MFTVTVHFFTLFTTQHNKPHSSIQNTSLKVQFHKYHNILPQYYTNTAKGCRQNTIHQYSWKYKQIPGINHIELYILETTEKSHISLFILVLF